MKLHLYKKDSRKALAFMSTAKAIELAFDRELKLFFSTQQAHEIAQHAERSFFMRGLEAHFSEYFQAELFEASAFSKALYDLASSTIARTIEAQVESKIAARKCFDAMRARLK